MTTPKKAPERIEVDYDGDSDRNVAYGDFPEVFPRTAYIHLDLYEAVVKERDEAVAVGNTVARRLAEKRDALDSLKAKVRGLECKGACWGKGPDLDLRCDVCKLKAEVG